MDRELNNFTNNNSVGTRQCRVPTREFALNSILIPMGRTCKLKNHGTILDFRLVMWD